MSEPANLLHSIAVYKYMKDNATTEKIEGHDVEVWVGFTTKIFEKLGIPIPYYTFTLQKLVAMGCIEKLQRGGGGSPSKWLLIREPDRNLYEATPDRPKGRPNKAEFEKQFRVDMVKYAQSLEKRIATLEEIVSGSGQ